MLRSAQHSDAYLFAKERGGNLYPIFKWRKSIKIKLRDNHDHAIIKKMRDKIKSAARDLRKNQTETEDILWKRLRNRGFLGKKFLRQHPILFTIEGEKRFFIADFYCNEKRLVVEIDGKIRLKQKEYDQYRDLIVQGLGLQVIRVTNETIQAELGKFLIEILTPILAD